MSEKEKLVYAFLEDKILKVYESKNIACLDIEGLDVEEYATFFNSNGEYLKPVFDKPNKRTKIFGLFSFATNGEYHLELDSSESALCIADFLKEDYILEPTPLFKTYQEIKDLFNQ